MGIYLLGGQISAYEYNRTIWQIRCNSGKTAELPEASNNLSVSAKYIVELVKVSTEGPEPTPRAMQTSIFYKKYIVIFGGRNDLEQTPGNYCLNDIMLLDLKELKWKPIVIYGFTPCKRWGHGARNAFLHTQHCQDTEVFGVPRHVPNSY